MGFFDFLGGGSAEDTGDVEKARNPLTVATKFTPLRMRSHKDEYVTLDITVKNNLAQKQLVSIDALLPKSAKLGFDRLGIHKFKEERLGVIAPGETKRFSLQLHGNTNTKPDNYEIEILGYSHYLDYKKVLNHVKKVVYLRVV